MSIMFFYLLLGMDLLHWRIKLMTFIIPCHLDLSSFEPAHRLPLTYFCVFLNYDFIDLIEFMLRTIISAREAGIFCKLVKIVLFQTEWCRVSKDLDTSKTNTIVSAINFAIKQPKFHFSSTIIHQVSIFRYIIHSSC